jgi:thiamine biosynthesis lipoprotein
MNTKNSQILLAILGVLLVIALYFFIPRGSAELDSNYRLVMGTFARVVVIAADRNVANKCIDAAFAEINKVDALMSKYKSDSEISIVNRDGFKRAVGVSDSVYEVLQKSIEFSKLTDGAFDITVGPLVDLFHSSEKTEVAPSEEEIAQAETKVGFKKLELNGENKTVRFTVEGMQLDLGGIAKGYAVDKAIEAVQKAGALGAMVDIGGNIRCFGTTPRGKDNWLIGVQNPKAVNNPNLKVQSTDGNDYLLTLKLKDKAVATSGDYQQFVIINGNRYSHILNPHTGTSAEGLSSVTIITDNATDADALSTAVSVTGIEKGLALIEKLPNTEAILITSQPKNELIKTSGADKYTK